MNTKSDPIGDMILSSQVAQALKIVGDRWSFLILRDVFLGNHRFEDLRRRTHAARGTLTSRLKALVEDGILHTRPYQTSPTRHEYRFTAKGADLFPLALTAWRWEHDWGTGEEHYVPSRLIHKGCGKVMQPEVRCEQCQELVRIWDVQYAPGPGAHRAEPVPPRFQRRSKTRAKYPEGVDTSFFHIADIVGDRWTGLVVAALFFGLHRYDEIAEAIGIATNILADRLHLLTDAGIVERRAYQHKPTRHAYYLTQKGWDLYGHTLMMHQWADKWAVEPGRPPLILTHKPCGKPLKGIVVCDQCGEQLTPSAVSMQ